MIYRCRQCGAMPAAFRRTGRPKPNRAQRRAGALPTLKPTLVTLCCGSSTYDTVVEMGGLEDMLRAKLESGELQEIA